MGRLMSKYSYIALAPLYSWPVVHRPIPPGTQQPMVLMVPGRILAPVLTARAKCSPHIHQARSTLTQLVSLSLTSSHSHPHSHSARPTHTQLVPLSLSSSRSHSAHLSLIQLTSLSPSLSSSQSHPAPNRLVKHYLYPQILLQSLRSWRKCHYPCTEPSPNHSLWYLVPLSFATP